MNLRKGFTLGRWTVYPLEGSFEDGDNLRRVQPKSMDVLLCLAEAHGELVERETLLQCIWGERAVSDEPLTRCIGELRKALGDSRKHPEFIITIPKRGYRLGQPAAPLERDGQTRHGNTPVLTDEQQAKRTGTIKKLAVGAAVLILGALVQIGIERAVEQPDGENVPLASDSQVAFRSVAILPFADMTAEQDQAYFGDGLAEELISLLSRNPSLRVAARTSSFSFRDSQTPVDEIAARLGVAHVVEGSIRREGDRFRIAVQLITASDGANIWSEVFEEPFGEIFRIQDLIARHVATALEFTVLTNPQDSIRTDPQTYSLFLQARYTVREGSQASMEHAVDLLKEALVIDPGYAPGWSALAFVYSNLAGQGHWDWELGFKAARDAAGQAIEADPSYFGGYQRLAWIAHRYDGDIPAAFEYMQRALDLNGTDIGNIRNAAVLLLQAGKLDEAIAALHYVVQRSPMDPGVRYNLGVAYKYAGRFDEAEEQFREILRISPDYNGAEYQMAEVLLHQARPEESLLYWEGLSEHRPLMGKAVVFWDLGEFAASDEALAELAREYGDVWPDVLANVHAYRGELDDAFMYLEKDYEKFGAAGWGELKLAPFYDNLRDDPRWHGMLERARASDELLASLDLEFTLPTD